MGHDYNTFSFVRMGNMIFCLWAKSPTYLHKSNNGNEKRFPGHTEFLVSTLVKYAVCIQVMKSEETGTTSVSAVIATLVLSGVWLCVVFCCCCCFWFVLVLFAYLLPRGFWIFSCSLKRKITEVCIYLFLLCKEEEREILAEPYAVNCI